MRRAAQACGACEPRQARKDEAMNRFWDRWLWKAWAPRRARKASRLQRLMAWQSFPRPQWGARDAASLARLGFQRNVVAYRCVRMIAEAAAAVPWQLLENGVAMAEHPLLDLLARPNPLQAGPDLLEDWYAYLQVAGNSYMEVVRAGDAARELYVLRPDRMQLVPGRSGWPAVYQYTVDGRSQRFVPEPGKQRPILHLALFHPLDDHYGLSPLEAAASSVELHNAASGWNKALFDNAARPSGALVYRGTETSPNMTEEQFARLKSELEQNFQGQRNAGRPLLLEGGLEWTPLSLSPQDMDFIAAKHAAAREIALAFGVPPMLLGIPGDNTYANYAEANRAFWRQTVLPLAERSARAFAHWFQPGFGGQSIVLRCQLDGVPALAEERERLWRRVRHADFLSVNEKRALVGLTPLPEGDELPDAPHG